MGYTTYVDIDLILKDKMTKEVFDAKVSEWIEKDPEGDRAQFEDLTAEGNGYIALVDYDRNHFEAEVLGDFLKDFVKKGEIACRGEEGEKYKIRFNGKNDYEIQDCIEYYDNAYDEFLREYEKELPTQLKKDLKKWWVMRHI